MFFAARVFASAFPAFVFCSQLGKLSAIRCNIEGIDEETHNASAALQVASKGAHNGSAALVAAWRRLNGSEPFTAHQSGFFENAEEVALSALFEVARNVGSSARSASVYLAGGFREGGESMRSKRKRSASESQRLKSTSNSTEDHALQMWSSAKEWVRQYVGAWAGSNVSASTSTTRGRSTKVEHEPHDDEQPLLPWWGSVICGALGLGIVLVWQLRGGQPLSVVSFLPLYMRFLVPAVFHTVADITHLGMVVSFCFGVFVLAKGLLNLVTWSCTDHTCAKTILSVGWLAPCAFYLYAYISHYDDSSLSRGAELAKTRDELFDKFDDMLTDTEDILQHASESNVGLAEESINSFARDMRGFLAWLAKIPEERFAEAKEPTKRFIMLWLSAFEEASLDPIEQPRRGGDKPFAAVLEANPNVTQAANVLAQRLKLEKIGFISEEMKILLEKKKSLDAGRMSATRTMSMHPGDAAETITVCCRRTRPSERKFGIAPMHGHTPGGLKGDQMAPFKIMGCCFVLIVQSGGHLTLLVATVGGPLLLGIYALDAGLRGRGSEEGDNGLMVWAIILFTICLAVVSWTYERISLIMQVHQEIENLDSKKQEFSQQRNRIDSLFHKQQWVVEFWLGRTIPILELLHEIQQRIRDAYRTEPAHAGEKIVRICQLVDDLMYKVGDASHWIGRPHKENTALSSWVRSAVETPGDLQSLTATLESNLAKFRVDFPV